MWLRKGSTAAWVETMSEGALARYLYSLLVEWAHTSHWKVAEARDGFLRLERPGVWDGTPEWVSFTREPEARDE